MKNISLISGITCLIAACATSPSGNPNLGRFVMAGPVSADAPVASMRWQYGLQLSVDPKSISEIAFNCDPISGTTFTAKGENLQVLKNGSIVAEGPVLALSKESTPWLFDSTTTSATCSAKISRGGQTDTMQVPVSFSGTTKAITAAQLKEAHEYNSRLKKK